MSAEDDRRRGTVVAFDEHRGLGAIADEDDGELPFHCTAIADGSRTLPTGVAVEFEVGPGLGGRWEARRVTRV